MRHQFVQCSHLAGLMFSIGLQLFCLAAVSQGQSAATFAQRAEKQFIEARTAFEKQRTNVDAAWKFGRAAFDRAEFSKDNAEREQIARQGIDACRLAIKHNPKLAPGRYYLGMNLGQLARTKTVGALSLVREMEREFLAARDQDESFDFAGPDRNLGLLYLEAPSFSIGDRTKARKHLQRAVALRPDYPENRLNLLDAYLRWNEKQAAKDELVDLRKIWPQAKKNLQGPEWESAWADWENRLAKFQRSLREN